MKRTRKYVLLCFTLLMTFAILVSGCGDSKKDARNELAKMNVDYTVDAFNQAIENHDNAATDLFFKSGFDLSLKGELGKTPLMAAAKSDNEDVMKKILDTTADRAKDVDDANRSALMYAIMNKQVNAMNMLSDASDWSLADLDGNTVLHLAVLTADADTVNAVLSHDVDINAKNQKGQTALFLAADKGALDIVKALLDKGADKSIADTDGTLPVQAALKNGNKDIVSALGGAPVEEKKQDTTQQSASSQNVITYHVDAKAGNISFSKTSLHMTPGQTVQIVPDSTSDDMGPLRANIQNVTGPNTITMQGIGNCVGRPGDYYSFTITANYPGDVLVHIGPDHGDAIPMATIDIDILEE